MPLQVTILITDECCEEELKEMFSTERSVHVDEILRVAEKHQAFSIARIGDALWVPDTDRGKS